MCVCVGVCVCVIDPSFRPTKRCEFLSLSRCASSLSCCACRKKRKKERKREREREREKEKKRERERDTERESVCVFLCARIFRSVFLALSGVRDGDLNAETMV